FFFQAEDGIRDFHVTGVQTCALPIFLGLLRGSVAPDLALVALLPLTAALILLVLGARIFRARGLVARRLGRRDELFRVHVEALGELGLARQLERLRNDRRRGDRPDEREPAADGDAREQKRENERPPDALPLLERLGLVGELEEDREGAVLNEPVVPGDDGNRRAGPPELGGVFASAAQDDLAPSRAPRAELPIRAVAADRAFTAESQRLALRQHASREDRGAPDGSRAQHDASSWRRLHR